MENIFDVLVGDNFKDAWDEGGDVLAVFDQVFEVAQPYGGPMRVGGNGFGAFVVVRPAFCCCLGFSEVLGEGVASIGPAVLFGGFLRGLVDPKVAVDGTVVDGGGMAEKPVDGPAVGGGVYAVDEFVDGIGLPVRVGVENGAVERVEAGRHAREG